MPSEKSKVVEPRHFATNLMSVAASHAVLDQAFEHIYSKRIKDGHNSDIWGLKADWLSGLRDWTRKALLASKYQLSPIDVYGHRNGHRLTRWCSLDAVVLKAITIALGDAVQKHMSNCYHVKGTGGIKAALRTVNTKTKSYRYVVKSDIADFYASMDHDMVIEQCKKVIKDKRILAIIQQYMNRVEVKAGVHNLIERGIVKGCPLSPIMGALVLKSLDKMIPSDCAYVRYMDDWVIMTKTRGRLRRVIKKMHRIVQGLKFKLAWDKTFIAKIGKGFDFLGYRFNQLKTKSAVKQAQ